MNDIDWRPVPGYEGLYEVSSDGQVKRIAGSNKAYPYERILKPSRDSKGNGYLFVVLCDHGQSKQITIHRLVAWAFLGEQGERDVNHKNGIKTDNRLENLEYVTHQENMIHAAQLGLRRVPRGDNHVFTILSDVDVIDIRFAFALTGESLLIKDVAQYYGVAPSTISNILAGRTRRNAGVLS